MHDTAADVAAHQIVWIGAFDGDKLVGGLGYTDLGDHRVIDRLFVDPRYARGGIGRRLVATVLDTAEVRVSTGTANQPARSLYESLGFQATGTRQIVDGVTVTRYVRRP